MKVALKFIIMILAVILVTRSIEGVLTVQRETNRLNEDIRRDTALLGRIIKASVREIWQERGREEALALIDAFNLEGHPVNVSWQPTQGDDNLPTRQLDGDRSNALTSRNMVSVRKRYNGGGEIRHSFIPLEMNQANGFIRLSENLEERSRYVRHAVVREAIAGSIIVLVVGAAVMWLGFTAIGQPLDQLKERIVRIGKGDLTNRLEIEGRDEFSTLEAGLNDMCESLSASLRRERAETEKRLETLQQMRHMDRLTTIGRLAAGVAHELGTPLNVIIGRAGMIVDGTVSPGSAKIKEVAQIVKSQAVRMSSIIQHLLDFSRQRPPQRMTVNGADVVQQAIDLVNCLGHKARIRLQAPDNASPLIARIDPVQFQQVMTNLIENAVQAMPHEGEVIVSVRSTPAQPPPGVHALADNYLAIAVEDKGIGISEENLPNIFDPFFTTKDVGDGTGLGLSIAYGIVREHGGWIEVASEVNHGSCFTVYIPREIE